MNFQGKIIFISPVSQGVSKQSGKQWASLNFVVTNEQDRFPKSACFRIFGQDRINEAALNVGENVSVDFDIDAHEYNGRYFNELNAWRITRIASQNQSGQPQQYVPQSQQYAPQAAPTQMPAQNSNSNNDKLPF